MLSVEETPIQVTSVDIIRGFVQELQSGGRQTPDEIKRLDRQLEEYQQSEQPKTHTDVILRVMTSQLIALSRDLQMSGYPGY